MKRAALVLGALLTVATFGIVACASSTGTTVTFTTQEQGPQTTAVPATTEMPVATEDRRRAPL